MWMHLPSVIEVACDGELRVDPKLITRLAPGSAPLGRLRDAGVLGGPIGDGLLDGEEFILGEGNAAPDALIFLREAAG